jgi:hypothetical protein
MYDITLTGGVRLSMPESLREITVSQYCEFLQGLGEFTSWQNEQLSQEADVDAPGYQLERLRRIGAMVQSFCAELPEAPTLETLFTLPVGDYEKSLKQSFRLDDIADFDIDRSEATLYTLWANIVKVIESADLAGVGDEVSFSYKGERYAVKGMNRDRMTGRELPPDLTVHEAVEVLELRRKAQALLDAGKHEAKNVKWELLHRQLAILALKEGEAIPTDDLAFEQFVSERAAHFIGIDAETALRVDFFLAGRLGLWSSTLIAISSSTLLDHGTRRTRKREAKRKRETSPSPSGWVSDGYTSDSSKGAATDGRM